jgi:hypothetical protein
VSPKSKLQHNEDEEEGGTGVDDDGNGTDGKVKRSHTQRIVDEAISNFDKIELKYGNGNHFDNSKQKKDCAKKWLPSVSGAAKCPNLPRVTSKNKGRNFRISCLRRRIPWRSDNIFSKTAVRLS